MIDELHIKNAVQWHQNCCCLENLFSMLSWRLIGTLIRLVTMQPEDLHNVFHFVKMAWSGLVSTCLVCAFFLTEQPCDSLLNGSRIEEGLCPKCMFSYLFSFEF